MALCLYIIVDNAVAEITLRSAKGELLISPITVPKLRLKWKFFAGKDISATSAVANGVVYFPSWNGYIYVVNAFSSRLIRKQNLGELTGMSGTGTVVNVSVSRATPTIAGDILIIGIYGPAFVIAVSRSAGNLIWSTRLDPRPLALITSSGTFYMGLAKLDVRNGVILWQTYMLPDNGGKLGGNLYNAPAEVLDCQERQKNETKPNQPDQCIGPDINFNSILALDIDFGKTIWSSQLGGYDVFYFVCLDPTNTDCPPGPNMDADFGEAPMLLSIFANGRLRDVVVAVQKSGAWVALDANTGEILWTTANPSNDTSQGPVTLANGVLFAGSVASNGPFYAMDARTGTILWSYITGATIYGSASASSGCVYIGSGYSVGLARFHPTWTTGTSLFAFCIL
ncbi:hypothetical protein Acr_06g0003660 [Actinidia rufa]|uniref:Pyrrolo-quinoline quinone repeat domain-containing protein n=1 Tax=Actinidia rufa TaxID=165716 RepID=A0A7J0EQE8_9ERIC|nr:hypothetical protein Acr_06g0003660 [Actinidia rufa]